MSKKSASKQKAEQKKQKTKQAKKNRQKHDPLKWQEKKGKKKTSQQKKWNVQFSQVHPNCPLPLSTFPSKSNCNGCPLYCKYHLQ